MTDTTLRQALAYAARGWPILPCQPGRKTPATAHGVRDATTDLAQITAWFGRHPDWNLAIAIGAPGPDVLDVDQHGEAGNGYAAFVQLRKAGLLAGARAWLRTPSGGLHAYFTGTEQGNGRLPGHHLDFRARGGYIVAPPSQIGGRPYELLRRQQGQARLDWATVTRLLDPHPQHRLDRSTEWPADTSRLAGWVARLPEGNRNDGLFWAANRALEAGLTDLGELADAARKTGLEEREIARTLASARRADRPFDAEPSARRTPESAGQQREVEAS